VECVNLCPDNGLHNVLTWLFPWMSAVEECPLPMSQGTASSFSKARSPPLWSLSPTLHFLPRQSLCKHQFQITYIQQRCIQLIKNILTLQNISILNKCCSFELSSYQRILRTMITASTKILSSTTVFNIDSKKKCFLSTKSTFYSDF